MQFMDDQFRVKVGLAEMLKGGVIMDVTDETQARIAEDAGATSVMALERVPSDIRRDGGVARMTDPEIIERVITSYSIHYTKLYDCCVWCTSTTCTSRAISRTSPAR